MLVFSSLDKYEATVLRCSGSFFSTYTARKLHIEELNNDLFFIIPDKPDKSSEKVFVNRDNRGFGDLQMAFPKADTSLIEKVWNSGNSWGACFDLLGSIIASHGGDGIYLDQECNLLSEISWPPLTHFNEVQEGVSADMSMKMKVENPILLDAGWYVVCTNDLTAEEENEWEHVESAIPVQGMKCVSNSFSMQGSDDTEIDNSVIFATESIGSLNICAGPQKPTYLDILLKNAEIENPESDVPLVLDSVKRKWTPRVHVVDSCGRFRKDRQYFNAADKGDGHEDEDDGIWDLIDAHFYNKASTGVSKVRSIVRLTPLSQMKKNARIAAKS